MIRLRQLLSRLISFSKTEANGAIVLIILIVICLTAPSVYKNMAGLKYDGFEEDQAILDSLLKKFDFEPTLKDSPEIILKPFDPNKATVEELNSVGIPSFLSRRISNFRNAGGTFTVKSDLSEIYDFPDSLFQSLREFILLPEKVEIKERLSNESKPSPSLKRNTSANVIRSEPRYDETPFLIDINQADTTSLQKLYGIGSAYARRIAAFREALGGFHSVDQVRDLYGMTDSLYYQIKSFLHVSDTVSLKQISINIATFQQLSAHPYISYELTKEILSAKSKYGKFKKVEDMNRLTQIDSATIAKLAPYLKF